MKISASITKHAPTASRTKTPDQKGDSSSSTIKPSEKSLSLGSQLTDLESPEPGTPSVVAISPVRRVVSAQVGHEELSSDYGNDLPSPSALLIDINNSTGKVNGECNDTHQDSKIDGLFDWTDDWIDIDEPWQPIRPPTPEQNAPQSSDLINQQKQRLCFEDDFQASASFHHLDNNQPSKRTVPFAGENQHPFKKKKARCESSLSHRREGVLVGSNATNSMLDDDIKVPSPPAAASKDWEDIDSSLLDEFSDIVNFF